MSDQVGLHKVLLFAAMFLSVAFPVSAQTQSTLAPGSNINMVSGASWPGGDPFLQRQNEPSMAVSSRNPLHLLAAANDYRSVDIPGVTGAEENGDAWIGLFTSLNGGQSWSSTLLPGCPYSIPQCSGAPAIQGLQAAADPIVRAGVNGLFFVSGIGFSRGTNAPSAVFISTYIDNNDKENGNPIKFVSLKAVDTGTSGQFLDKPGLAVDIPRTGATVVSIPQDSGGGSFPVGNVYFAYSKFVGSSFNNPHSQVMFTRSTDGGQTWANPIKLSESYSLNQGVTIAIDPNSGAVYVVWRMVQNPAANQPDAILLTKSTDGGQTFKQASIVTSINPFDQDTTPTTPLTFRTESYPTSVVDGNGVLYIAWSQRGVGPGGDARVVLTTTPDLKKWSTPAPIDNPSVRGHQFMPAMTYAGGKILVTWYDMRDDHTYGTYTIGPGGKLTETRVSTLCSSTVTTGCDTQAQVFTPTISDAYLSGTSIVPLHWRHTVDVRVTQATQPPLGTLPSFEASNKVSRYTVGRRVQNGPIQQLGFNPPNFPMFVKGTTPFMGDYIDIAPSLLFVKNSSGTWTFNTSAANPTPFYAVWADNRDVRPPLDGNWANYKVPASAFAFNYTASSLYDPTQPQPTCSAGNPGDPGQTGMRNQNIYTALITQGLVVGSLGNTKPLNTQRGFVVFAQNNTDSQRTVTLSVTPPSGITASFFTDSTSTSINVDIPARSSIARTIWASSGTSSGPFSVSAQSADGLQPSLTGSTRLDPDSTNPTITNPDNLPAYLSSVNVQTLEAYNADISEPTVTVQTFLNADIVNADIVNADIVNADIVNADIVNADIVNADIVNADIVNADIVNADIVNADIVNSSLTDATWTVTNVGNTSTAYHVKLLSKYATLPTYTDPSGNVHSAKLQLIMTKVPTTPAALPVVCDLQSAGQNVLLASIPEPTTQTDPTTLAITGTDVASQGVKNATIALAPGEVGKITLRMTGVDSATASQFFQAFKVSVGNQKATRPLALIITTLTLPPGTVAAAYNQSLATAGGSGNAANLTWTLNAGALPPGVSFVNGTLTGTPTAAGDYTFTVRVDDAGDATQVPPIPPEHDIQVLTLHVNKGAASLSLSSSTVTYNGTPQPAAFTTTPAGLSYSVTYNSSTAVPTATGTYNVIATINDSNYSGSLTTSFTIAKAAASVTPAAAGKIYGAPDPNPLTTGTLSGFISSDNVTAAYSRTAGENVGTYTISATLNPSAALANYSVTYNTAIFTISMAAASVTPNAAGKVYGAPDPSPLTTGILSGFLASDNITATYSRIPGESVGIYAISATLGPAAALGNYTITYNTAPFTIGKASTSTSITSSSPNPSFVNMPVTVAFAVAVVAPGAGMPGGTVTVTIAGSATSCSAAVSVGSCSLTPTTTGTLTLTATYSGDVNFSGSSGTASQSVTPPFNFAGFVGPLVTAGTYTSPTYSGTVNQGQAIPIKWQLKDQSGNYVTNQSAASILTAEPNATCALAPGSAALSIPLSPSATGSTVLRYDTTGNQYVFNWDTSYQAKGCYNIVLKLADGTVRSTVVKIQ